MAIGAPTIQKGTTSWLSTDGTSTKDQTITSVDTTKTMILSQHDRLDPDPTYGLVGRQLVNGTTIRYHVHNSTGLRTGSDITWQAVEFPGTSTISVEHGSAAAASDPTDITISRVTMSEAFAIVTQRNSGGTWSQDDWIAWEFIEDGGNPGTSVTLRIDPRGSNADRVVYYQIVSSTDLFVQHVSAELGTTDASVTATLGTAVTTGQTGLVVSYNTDAGTSTNYSQKTLAGYLTNSTTVTFTRQNTGQAMTAKAHVIEWPAEVKVQRGQTTDIGTVIQTHDFTIPEAVVIANTVPNLTGHHMHMGETYRTSNDDPIEATFRATITTTTNLQLYRAGAANSANVRWEVWEFGISAPAADERRGGVHFIQKINHVDPRRLGIR